MKTVVANYLETGTILALIILNEKIRAEKYGEYDDKKT